ncbi:GIY-YIG nuclease family protein [Tessaracoccus sp. HDW20]|uniref:GIY-YIG nuclease family protein n=1 Tax=Tessaracoccus coleopterorum TaxID=2714950 RepID=UPI0018D467AD|nr:GIY-YIG nuclease family protein [Tessaracoccus coleopterorum]NHB85360.1 GIY-YIG nuclease family protein [Tessaracoccus coleopterorum]
MEYTYILECADGSHYVGTAHDLALRLSQHRDGTGSTWTRLRRPISLVWAAAFPDNGEAALFEEEVRGWRREHRDALIAGRLAEVPAPDGGPAGYTRTC